MVGLFVGARKNWKFVLVFILLSVLFWLLQFGFQFYLLKAPLDRALIRSFSLSGGTLIALSLLCSPIFKWFPKYAKYWAVRRSLGVMGVALIGLHAFSAIFFVFNWDLDSLFFSWNPIENPVLFGVFALPIFFLVALVSTDWAMQKLGTKWKAIQRLVYLAFWAAAFHFLRINPTALMNPFGYLLLATTFLALSSELYWFLQTVFKKKSFSLGTALGILFIFLYLVTAYFAWFVR